MGYCLHNIQKMVENTGAKKTPHALQADARHAFMLVENSYAAASGLRYRADNIHRIFHFVEEKRWAYYLRYIARFNVAKEKAVEVEGVTHSYGDAPKIGVNKAFHTYGTLVHESVHFFSHYAFRKAFSVDEHEGATEYLTRSLLGELGPRRDVHGQGDIYAREFALFESVIVSDEGLRQLCKAYFVGDDRSISQLKVLLMR